jgi:hypothetical protein
MWLVELSHTMATNFVSIEDPRSTIWWGGRFLFIDGMHPGMDVPQEWGNHGMQRNRVGCMHACAYACGARQLSQHGDRKGVHAGGAHRRFLFSSSAENAYRMVAGAGTLGDGGSLAGANLVAWLVGRTRPWGLATRAWLPHRLAVPPWWQAAG